MNINITPIAPFGTLIEPKERSQSIFSIDTSLIQHLFEETALILIRGFGTFSNADDFARYAESFGKISLWPFGKILELKAQQKPEDHIFDTQYVPMHWDGMYREQVPLYQIFHCVKAPPIEHGGETTFSHTKMLLDNASNAEKNLWRKVTGHYQRQMAFYNSEASSLIITKHPFKNYDVVRYNEPPNPNKGRFINPANLSFSGINSDKLSLFHDSLQKALYSQNNFYAHQWQDSDVVIADNFTLLHGRESFKEYSQRHLQRIHVLSNPPLENPSLVAYK